MRIRPAASGAASQEAYPSTFAVRCGIPFLIGPIVASLEQFGLREDPAAPPLLILDFPPGFALSALADAEAALRQTIVVTGSLCPEYWESLADLGAQIVISGEHGNYPLHEVFRHAAMGARYRVAPDARAALAPTQRRVLHLLACGYSSQQIAEQLSKSDQSVRNMLTTIYRLLGVADRNAAQNYYWGIWPPIAPAAPSANQDASEAEIVI